MKFDLLVATPTSGMCRAAFAFSLAKMAMHFTQVPIYPEIQEQTIDFIYWEGTGVAHNREKAVERLLSKGGTHLLFIDDDMGFNPDTLHILASRRVPIVGCNYRVRTPPAPFMAYRDGEIKTTKEKKGLESVTYMGFGFCLIERRVFESIDFPRFKAQSNNYNTEDHDFFTRQPFPVYVDHDASKQIWHSGNVNYTWADDFSNIGKLFK